MSGVYREVDFLVPFISDYIENLIEEIQKLRSSIIPVTLALPALESLFISLLENISQRLLAFSIEIEYSAIASPVGWFLHYVEIDILSFMEDLADVFPDEHTHQKLCLFFECVSHEGAVLLNDISVQTHVPLAPIPPRLGYDSEPG